MFILKKLIYSLIFQVFFYGGILFPLAGTWCWERAWVFLGVMAFITMALMLMVFRAQPDLLRERFKSPIQEGQPLADKIILSLFIATYLGVMILIPLDVFRWRLLPQPETWLSSLGLILFVAGWWIIGLAFRENPFAIPVVRHQTERRQSVIDTGVYGLVRHPMYVGGILQTIGMPLWLESSAATLFAIFPSLLLGAIRIYFEERFLERELPGYVAYMQRVRHRLIPFIW